MNRPTFLDGGAGRAAAAIELLVPAHVPARPRMQALLDGALAGRVVVDDATAPRWAIVVETADGTVWAGGDLTLERVEVSLRGLATRSGDLIFGFAGPDDPLRDLVPATPTGGARRSTSRAGNRRPTSRHWRTRRSRRGPGSSRSTLAGSAKRRGRPTRCMPLGPRRRGIASALGSGS